MRFHDADLLPGERLLTSKFASAVLTAEAFGVSELPGDLEWLSRLRGPGARRVSVHAAGTKQRQEIGGRLHLTSYRLLFRSHPVNTFSGEFEIFLPAVVSLRDTSFLWMRECEIETGVVKHEFMAWGVGRFLKAIAAARDALSADSLTRIREAVLARGALQTVVAQPGVQLANGVVAGGKPEIDVAEFADNPLKAIASLAIKELFDQTVTERWNGRFQ